MSKICLACFNYVGAERINSCFLTVSRMEWPLTDQMIARNLTKRWNSMWGNGSSPSALYFIFYWTVVDILYSSSTFVSPFVSVCMSWLSASNAPPRRKMSSVWYHTCTFRESCMQLRSCLWRFCAMAGLLRYSMCSWVKVDYVFEDEGKFQLRDYWNWHWIEHIHQI